MKIQGDIAFIPMKAENIEFKKLENALVVAEGEVIITHPQHASIIFPIGDWKIIRQREYDESGERKVQD